MKKVYTRPNSRIKQTVQKKKKYTNEYNKMITKNISCDLDHTTLNDFLSNEMNSMSNIVLPVTLSLGFLALYNLMQALNFPFTVYMN